MATLYSRVVLWLENKCPGVSALVSVFPQGMVDRLSATAGRWALWPGGSELLYCPQLWEDSIIHSTIASDTSCVPASLPGSFYQSSICVLKDPC